MCIGVSCVGGNDDAQVGEGDEWEEDYGTLWRWVLVGRSLLLGVMDDASMSAAERHWW